MLLTVPLVLIGIFRYQLLSDPSLSGNLDNNLNGRNCENPVMILFNDNFIKILIMIWIISVITITAFSNLN